MSSAQVDRLLAVLSAYFSHASKPAAGVAKKINAVYQFNLDNGAKKFVIDLKTGAIRQGEDAEADCTFSMKSDDFLGLAAGKLNPQTAFMTGKLKIKGAIGVAMKFTPNVFPKIDPKLLGDSTKTPEQVVASVLSAKL